MLQFTPRWSCSIRSQLRLGALAALSLFLLVHPPPAAGLDVSDPTLEAFDPAVAVAPDGERTVAWTVKSGSCTDLRVATVGKEGPAALERSIPGIGKCAEKPDIAADVDGTATLTWIADSPGGRGRAVQFVRIGTDGEIGAVQDIGGYGDRSGRAQVAVDRRGRAAIVFTGASKRGGGGPIRIAELGADGSLLSIGDLSRRTGFDPRLALAGSGRGAVVWTASGSSVQARSIALGRPDGRIRTLTGKGRSSAGRPADVDVSTQGVAAIVWGDYADVIYARLDAAGRILGRSKVLSAAASRGHAYDPRVAFDAGNSTTVAWVQRRRGKRQVVRTSVRAGTPLLRPTTVADGRAVELAVDPGGTATAAFAGVNRGASIVRLGGGYHQGAIKRLTVAPIADLVTASARGRRYQTVALAIRTAGSSRIVLFRIASR